MITVYNKDCLDVIRTLDNNSIDLIVTSPPYKEIDGFSYETMYNIFNSLYHKISDNGLLFINFGHLSSHKNRPFVLVHYLMSLGYNFIDTIIWVKNHYTPISGNKRLNNITEFIFMLSKTNKYELDRLSIGIPYKDKSNVKRYGNGNDLRCAGNVWYIDYPTVNKKEEKPHKDMFPVELPLRCIKLAGKNVNTVLDCFAGSGTTGQACQILNKNFIGIEKDKKYFDIMCQQLNVSNA